VEVGGQTLIGVSAGARFVYPLGLTIDTADIGGPSAGLAMTLALLDELTKGDLTGGKRIVVTGTINPDATVGEIGEIRLKAIAARRNGAQIFIVPACTDTDKVALADCKTELASAENAAKGIKVIPVKTLDDALRALVANGGDPLPKVGTNAP
jgi:PDZ domain-containing protein